MTPQCVRTYGVCKTATISCFSIYVSRVVITFSHQVWFIGVHLLVASCQSWPRSTSTCDQYYRFDSIWCAGVQVKVSEISVLQGFSTFSNSVIWSYYFCYWFSCPLSECMLGIPLAHWCTYTYTEDQYENYSPFYCPKIHEIK